MRALVVAFIVVLFSFGAQNSFGEIIAPEVERTAYDVLKEAYTAGKAPAAGVIRERAVHLGRCLDSAAPTRVVQTPMYFKPIRTGLTLLHVNYSRDWEQMTKRDLEREVQSLEDAVTYTGFSALAASASEQTCTTVARVYRRSRYTEYGETSPNSWRVTVSNMSYSDFSSTYFRYEVRTGRVNNQNRILVKRTETYQNPRERTTWVGLRAGDIRTTYTQSSGWTTNPVDVYCSFHLDSVTNMPEVVQVVPGIGDL